VRTDTCPPVTAAYDALNRLTTLNDAVGTSAFAYANFGAFSGALATEDGPWASDTVTYGYSQRQPSSLVLTQPSGSWSEGFGCDGLQRLTSLSSPAGSFGYGYNGAGSQINTLTLPGNSITKTYDAAGQLLTTALTHSSTVLDGYTYVYDLNGNRSSVTRADNAAVNYGYDNIGQLVSAQGFESGGLPRGNENFGYGFDAAGNLLLRTNNTLIQSFSTDNANQLLNVTRNNDLLTVAGSMSVSNAFTVNGQSASIYRDLTFAVTNGVSVANGLNVLTAVVVSNSIPMTNKTVEFLPTTVNIANDANGNLISDGLHGYEYDSANELTRITVTNILKAEFVYDGIGRKRIRKEFTWQTNQWLETNEIHYVYDGMLVIQERASNNTPLVTYTRGIDPSSSMQGAGGIGGLMARTDAYGNSAFYHADGNGNITMLVSNNGVALAKYLYDTFGNTLGMWGTLASANVYRFSSKEFEPYTGIYYYGYRFYQPNLQRWLNRDPTGEAGGINLYGFVGNDPIKFSDPNGLTWLLFDKEAWEQLGHDKLFGDTTGTVQDPNSQGVLSANAGYGFHPLYDADGNPLGNPATAVIKAGTKPLVQAGMLVTPIGDEEAIAALLAKIGKSRCFKSFSALKRAMPNTPGNLWHHIVEQSQESRFGTEAVQNADNVIEVTPQVNQSLNALYSSIRPEITGSDKQTVRQWLSTQTFNQAQSFGMKAVIKVSNGTWP